MQKNAESGFGPSVHSEFQSFFLTHHRTILKFFRARVGVENSEDLVQDTFLKAYKNMRSRYTEPTLPWLLAIADNTWKNWLRDKSAAKRNARESPIGDHPESSVDPSTRRGRSSEGQPFTLYSVKEDMNRLEHALNRLPPRMRQCFVLFFLQERKYREIALIMGIDIQTVKSQINQARQRLNLYWRENPVR